MFLVLFSFFSFLESGDWIEMLFEGDAVENK